MDRKQEDISETQGEISRRKNKRISVIHDYEKVRNTARMIILEDVVREWIQRSRSQGQTINDTQILNTVHMVSKLIKLDTKTYQITPSWLHQLKNRLQIISLNPLRTGDACNDDSSKKSLNVVDILFEMKTSKAFEGSSHLSKHILEQLESSCESIAQAASSSEIVLRSSPNSSLGSQVNEADIAQPNPISIRTYGNERRVLQKHVLGESFGESSQSNCGRAAEDALSIIEILDESDDDDVVLLNNDLTPSNSSKVQPTKTDECIVLEEEYIISSGDEIEKEEYIINSSGDKIEKDKLVLQDVPDNSQTNKAHSGDFEVSNSSNVGTEKEIKNAIRKQDKFKPITSYKDAIQFLGPLEDFASTNNNIRAKEIIKQLVTVFLERMSLDND